MPIYQNKRLQTNLDAFDIEGERERQTDRETERKFAYLLTDLDKINLIYGSNV